MPISRQSKLATRLTFIALSLGMMGSQCDPIPTGAANSTCDPGEAQIAFWDGKIQKVCGCGGTDGEFAAPGAALTCTVQVGTVVFANFHGPFLQHQIVPVGTPAMPASAVFDPKGSAPIRGYAYQTTTTGTFAFQDGFDHSIFGNLIVTP